MSHERFYSRVNGPTDHQFNHVRWLEEVAPRHLAGGGDPRHVTEYLLAAGWGDHSVRGYPHVLLESPDHQLHLTLEPTAPEEHDTWWRIHPAEDRFSWTVHFGGNTPVEIIAGFTDALANPAPTATTDLWQLAASRGWTTLLAGTERAALSPDETAVLARTRVPLVSDTPVWRWKAEVSIPLGDGRHRWIWGAAIDEAAPTAALTGFVTALTDPTPLLRDEGQSAGGTFGYADSARSTVTPEQHRLNHLWRLEDAQRTRSPGPITGGLPSPPGPAHRRKRR